MTDIGVMNAMAADPASTRKKVGTREAARILGERDPVIKRLALEVGLPSFPKPKATHFAALARAITSQQLATAAAQAIYGRLLVAVDGDLSATRIDSTPGTVLRAAGLSGNKVDSLKDLSRKVLDGAIDLTPRALARRSDEAIQGQLTTVRGIGKWSGDMFLIFQLRRLDVWPTGDLEVRRGFGLAWGVPIPTIKELDAVGERYVPYRSVAAWYCWRAARTYGARVPRSVAKR
jgi:DNA-3-methyladenine glycosylase II